MLRTAAEMEAYLRPVIAGLEAEVELANHHLERCREGYRLQYEALGVYQREQEELKRAITALSMRLRERGLDGE